MAQNTPILLYCNTGEEDKKAIQVILESGLPHISLGPDSELPTPYLRYGFFSFYGLKSIRDFISNWKRGIMPNLDSLL